MSDYSIQSYRDLKLWQEAMNLAEYFYKLTKLFPKEKFYGMTSQISKGCKGRRVSFKQSY
jgi:hypothetical protein